MIAATARSRAVNAFLWGVPLLFLLWVFWDGLQCWFLADDFAWLSLTRQLHSGSSLLSLLFAPAAQGTIRPWSERGFFLLFESLFGLDALPFRVMAFATMAVNLTLLAWITRRLTGSPVAGSIAAIVWSANTALMTAMTWSAAYNQALCPFFLLSALALFILYAKTGKRRFWWLQLAVFVIGFGALEINIVYPALALAWALFVVPRPKRRELALSVAPLAAISIIYFFIHRAVAPLPSTGAYVLHFDGRIFRSLALYGKWSLLPVDWGAFGHSHRAGKLILWIEIAALVLLFASAFRRRRSAVLFCVAWYLATLAPVLPLPDHHSDYYLTIPLAGLAMAAGWGFSCAWRESAALGASSGQSVSGRRIPARAWQLVAALAIGAYLVGMVPVSRAATRWTLEKTTAVRGLVLGVEAAHERHPGKIVLVDGVTDQLYKDSVGQGAFYPLGDFVYLTPGSDLNIHGGPDLADLDKMVVDPAAVFHAVQNDQVVVYSLAGDHLRNMTEAYERSAPNRLIDSANNESRLPGRVDVGNPLYSWLLGPSWMPAESGVRWMPGKATVRMKSPQPGNKLLLEGYCPEEQLKTAPRHLIVTADGISVGETQIGGSEVSFRRLFALAPILVGREEVEIEIHVDPVVRRDGTDYGLLFGKISLVP